MPDIELVPIAAFDGANDVLWKIMLERSEPSDAHTNISHKVLPTRDEHDKFVRDHPFWLWFIVCDGSTPIGQVRISMRNEIGVSFLREHRGKGYGDVTLTKVLRVVKPRQAEKSVRRGCFVANINPDNMASRELFKKHGFKHVQNTYVLEDE